MTQEEILRKEKACPVRKREFHKYIIENFFDVAEISSGNNKYILLYITNGHNEVSKTEKKINRETFRKIISKDVDQHYQIAEPLIDDALKEFELEFGKYPKIARQSRLEKPEPFYLVKEGMSFLSGEYDGSNFALFSKESSEEVSGDYGVLLIPGGGWLNLNKLEKKIILSHNSAIYSKKSSVRKSESLNPAYKYNSEEVDIGTHEITKEILENLFEDEYKVEIRK